MNFKQKLADFASQALGSKAAAHADLEIIQSQSQSQNDMNQSNQHSMGTSCKAGSLNWLLFFIERMEGHMAQWN